MARFLLKCLAYAAALVALVAVYVYGCDPLRVMRWHSDCYSDGVITNIGVAGVENFEHNPDRRRFDSFILGSSVSKNLLAAEWKRYLPDSARIYHLSTDGQMIPATRIMLEYAARQVDSLRHVIIVTSMWSVKEDVLHGNVFDLHPHVYTDPYRRLAAWLPFIGWSLNRNYIAAKLDYDLSGFQAPKFRHWLDVRPGTRYDASLNELLISGYASDSVDIGSGMYAGIQKMCASLRLNTIPSRITPKVEADLRAIAAIADRHGATLDFVLVNNEVPSARDDSIFCDIFGRRYHNMTTAFVADRRNPANYYDKSHLFPELTTRIVDAALSASE